MNKLFVLSIILLLMVPCSAQKYLDLPIEKVASTGTSIMGLPIGIERSPGYSGPVGPDILFHKDSLWIVDILNNRLVQLDSKFQPTRTMELLVMDKVYLGQTFYSMNGNIYMQTGGDQLYRFKDGKLTAKIGISGYDDFWEVEDLFIYQYGGELYAFEYSKSDSFDVTIKIMNSNEVLKYTERHSFLDKYGIHVDGKSIYKNNRIQTRNYGQYIAYWTKVNKTPSLKNKEASIFDVRNYDKDYVQNYSFEDHVGNTYWTLGSPVLVFNRSGFLITAFIPAQDKILSLQKTSLAFHPSGDIFFLDYDDKVIDIYRIRNVWDPEGRKAWYDAHGGDIVPAASTSPKSQFASTTDPNVRMRSEPNVSGKLLVELAKGTELVVLDRSEKKETISGREAYWYKVRRKSDGLEGWLFGGFLKIEE